MPTTLDPQTALIVIDLQKGLLRPELASQLLTIAVQTRELADAFRSRGLSVVWVTVTGGAPGRTEQPRRGSLNGPGALELLPELAAQPGDLYIQKRNWGAFIHTDLEAQLRGRGVTGVVICGVSTSMGVESTARQAYELGFNVTLVTDAMTDFSPEAHHNSLERIFPRLGETGSAAQILSLLQAQP